MAWCNVCQIPYPDDLRFHICTPPLYQVPGYCYSQYRAFNKFIAVEPWPEDEQKPKVVSTTGFAVVKNRASLKGLKVVFGSSEYPADSTVFVRAELYTHGFAKEVFEVDGKRVILLPVEHIMFVRYGEVAPPVTLSVAQPKDPSAL